MGGLETSDHPNTTLPLSRMSLKNNLPFCLATLVALLIMSVPAEGGEIQDACKEEDSDLAAYATCLKNKIPEFFKDNAEGAKAIGECIAASMTDLEKLKACSSGPRLGATAVIVLGLAFSLFLMSKNA